ncbi:MAG: substrate-binding domain-containing protein [Aristaeellaceae bacterium]
MLRRCICIALAALLLISAAIAEEPAWSWRWDELVELKTDSPRYLARHVGRWSLLDGEGRVLQDGWLDGFDGFVDGVAAVRTRGKWGFLLESGEFLVEPCYDYAGPFVDGIARVELDGLRGYIDRSGETLIEPRFYRANDFQGDYATVARQGAYVEDKGSSSDYYEPIWGVIDRTGALVLPMEYDSIEINADDSVAVAKLGTEKHCFHLSGSTAEEVAQVGSSFALSDYYPNEGGRVASLDEAAEIEWDANAELPRLDGATALFPVYSAVVQATYPQNVRFEVEADDPLVTCTRTNRAYERLIEGSADMIFCAGPSEEQLWAAAAEGVELELTPFGAEAFVFIVNADNPLEDITTEQLRGVYSGAIADWSALGVDGLGEIVAYQRPKNSGSQTALEKLMGDVELMIPPQQLVSDGMGDILETIEYRNLPNAIGYSFRFYCTEMVGSGVKLLSIDGVEPTLENIRSGAYPHVTTLYAVTRRGETNPNVQILLSWLTSDQGQALVEKCGYVAATK